MIEKIGNDVLNEMNIEFLSKETQFKKVCRLEIDSFKQSILEKYSSAQNSFLFEGEDEDHQECSICHFDQENELFAFPLQIQISNLPNFLDTIDLKMS